MSAKTLGDELHDEQAQAAYEREMERRKAATLTEQTAFDYVCNWRGTMPREVQENARTELSALRATVEAQARKLEEAREIFTLMDGDYMLGYYRERVDAWLAANAPAPQA